MVLIPKRVNAISPNAFRPMSLQNGTPKALAKLLANRFKPIIPELIHNDQTGFLQGRSIAENFMYAADLITSRHQRQKQTMIFKLDFKKAFNSVSWTCFSIFSK